MTSTSEASTKDYTTALASIPTRTATNILEILLPEKNKVRVSIRYQMTTSIMKVAGIMAKSTAMVSTSTVRKSTRAFGAMSYRMDRGRTFTKMRGSIAGTSLKE